MANLSLSYVGSIIQYHGIFNGSNFPNIFFWFSQFVILLLANFLYTSYILTKNCSSHTLMEKSYWPEWESNPRPWFFNHIFWFYWHDRLIKIGPGSLFFWFQLRAIAPIVSSPWNIVYGNGCRITWTISQLHLIDFTHKLVAISKSKMYLSLLRQLSVHHNPSHRQHFTGKFKVPIVLSR